MLKTKNNIVARNKEHLLELIKKTIACDGLECDLNHIDVSQVTDMYALFHTSPFNGNISEWDVSNVTDMCAMFYNSPFNTSIDKWNVSNVANMCAMFWNSKFKGDISRWNAVNVQSIDCMIDPDKLCLFEKPTMFHWFSSFRDENIMTSWPQDWQEHFMDHHALVQGLGLEGIAAAVAMQNIWLGSHSFEEAMTSNFTFDLSSLKA